MSNYNFYKRLVNTTKENGYTDNSLGERYLSDSDNIMESTWWNDPQAKIAYLYDYYHDDQKELNYGMTYENTTKTKVDIKFIITEKGSLSKDQPAAKIMFRPSMKTDFEETDELYYIKERMLKLEANENFTGLYLDIPDEKGVYRKWMICLQDMQGNQFQKYFVLPVNHKLQWIRKDGNKRIKQNMWCVLRSQSSYNSGSTWFALLEIVRAILF